MIFWSGMGWLVPAATFGVSLVAELVSEGITGNDKYYQDHGLAFALALWISAAINATVFWTHYSGVIAAHRSGSKKRKRAAAQNGPGWMDHTFMFINQGAWAVVMLLGGFGVLISRGI
jgi:hypothetical protein